MSRVFALRGLQRVRLLATLSALLVVTAGALAEDPVRFVDASSVTSQSSSQSWGTLKGRFVLKGPVPRRENIVLIRDFADLNYATPDESLLVDEKTRGIANAMVYVRAPDVAIHPDYARAVNTPRVMEYRGPRLVPRVASVLVNQSIVFRNANPFPHAVLLEPIANPKFNVVLVPGKNNELTKSFAQTEPRPLRIHDPAHSPSHFGWIMVANHPYVAITDEHGRFELRNLPAGELEFQCWHERCGWLAARPSWKAGRFTCTVPDGETHDLGDIPILSYKFFNDRRRDETN